MRALYKHISVILTLTILLISGCEITDDNNVDNKTRVEVFLISAVQSGGDSGVKDSSELILTFNEDPTTLTLDNIELVGAIPRKLTGSGTTRSLLIDFWYSTQNEDNISITISNPSGYTITENEKEVMIYRGPHVGMSHQGGIVFYFFQPEDEGYVEGEYHGLIAATKDQSSGAKWYNTDYINIVTTDTSFGSGLSNTTAIVDKQGAGVYAAKICDDYINEDSGTGVYDDWYLPSKDELELVWDWSYLLNLSRGVYWSSTESDGETAYSLSVFFNYEYDKSYYAWVRAIRTF